MRLSCLVEARVLFEENRLFVVVGRKYFACPNCVKVQIHAFERKLYILYFFIEFQFKMQTCFKCEIHNFSSTLILGLTS